MQTTVHPMMGVILGVGIITSAILSTLASIAYASDTNWLIQTVWIALNTWLFTGLFITAHDAMHGVAAPQNRRLNNLIGHVALLVYAGLSYQRLLKGHIQHHATPATISDPDYLPANEHFHPIIAVIRWYWRFMMSYLTWHPFVVIATLFTIADRIFGISVPNMLYFWILPQILSTLQLFYFGTYLPHRGTFYEGIPARSNQYPTWLSLLTCFHFGYHREHHLYPHIPWWGLPTVRHQENVRSSI